MLAAMRVPAATLNAVVQRMIPPPKYDIDRLIPTARVAPEAQIAGLVIIQRDDDFEKQLETDEAVEILLENCEDAFGFPPCLLFGGGRPFCIGACLGQGDLERRTFDLEERGARAHEGTFVVLALLDDSGDACPDLDFLRTFRAANRLERERDRAFLDASDGDLDGPVALLPIGFSAGDQCTQRDADSESTQGEGISHG